jgi:uncharacterized protein involved in response to NO
VFRSAVWALGFRPFYLAASLFASFSILLWMLQLAGALPQPLLQGPAWHAHEMVFGFAVPVIVGFLFTAGRNWTGLPTPTGGALAALVLLWLTGRVLVLTPWGWASAAVNAAFPVAAALALARPFVAASNRRNYFFVALLLLLGTASFAVHLVFLGAVELPQARLLRLALDVVLFIVAVMGGRVIPMFTRNGVPGTDPQRRESLERAALGLLIALAAATALGAPAPLVALLAAAAAVAHVARWLLWQPWATLRVPLTWVLHLAYAWIPVHLALRAAAELGWTGPSAGTHALTTGAIGVMIVGMMTRTARGHTGRPLRADGWDVACYLLVAAAALVRVLGALAWPSSIAPLHASAALWTAGFGLFALRYWSALTRPRVDGKPG